MFNLPIALLASMIEAVAGTWPADASEDRLLAARAALEAIAPRDFVEFMLAARMIAAHHATMDGYRRAAQPNLEDVEVIRLRASAIAASRSFDAALRLLEKRRAPADKPAQPRRRIAAEDPPAELDALAGYTAEEIAAAEYALDNDPIKLQREELEKRIPLHRYQDMTADERKIAYAPSAPLTPVQVAVLGVRLTKMNGSGRKNAQNT
jgi:hypothetical protein